MSIVVFVEGAEREIKKSSKESISYAAEIAKIVGGGQDVIAVVLGEYEDAILENLGNYGASKVVNASDKSLNSSQISVFTEVLLSIINSTGANLIILPKTAFCDNVGGRLAGKLGASIVSNVVALPEVEPEFNVKKSIFTGKAFATVSMTGDKKILLVKRNIMDLKEGTEKATLEKISLPADIMNRIKITGQQKAEGDVLLDDAEIVVSGGRGLKGPENWGMIEELAKALGAATGCSKPVSDMGWRPHHEHIGQTGVKVSPNIYIAIGISGAIQHLAGVNSSKVLVAINKDPEAPFFKAADYGIVGDAFEVVPKLTEKVKSL